MIYHLVDVIDQHIVYTGSLKGCKEAQERFYAGLTILPDTSVVVQKINKLSETQEEF